MCFEDLLNNELRIRPSFSPGCIDPPAPKNKTLKKKKKVHPACYFWNVCDNKVPLGRQVTVQKGSVFEPKL